MQAIIFDFKQYLINKNIPVEDYYVEDIEDFMWKESLHGEDIFNCLMAVKLGR